MSAMFVRAIAEIAEALVAMKRLQKYLMQDEFVKTQSRILPQELSLNFGKDKEKITMNGDSKDKYQKKDDCVIKVTNVESKWLADSFHLTLQINDMQIKRGKLIGVIGPIGSGKVLYNTSI